MNPAARHYKCTYGGRLRSVPIAFRFSGCILFNADFTLATCTISSSPPKRVTHTVPGLALQKGHTKLMGLTDNIGMWLRDFRFAIATQLIPHPFRTSLSEKYSVPLDSPKRPSSVELSALPIVLFETPRFSCGLLPTWCASQEPRPLSSLILSAVMSREPLPISPFVPTPSCAVMRQILLASVGLPDGLLPSRLTTRSRKSLDLTSRPVTAFACAQHEALGAHCLGFPLIPPRYLTADDIV